MKRLRLLTPPSTAQWRPSASPFLVSTTICQRCDRIQQLSFSATATRSSTSSARATVFRAPNSPENRALEKYPSPPPSLALRSAKLAALHARLALSHRFPLQTLARALIDRSADSDNKFNNVTLANLGSDLMGYYCSEHLICHYPRLPVEVLWEAQRAYMGAQAMAALAREWGVEPVELPGGEVDPGLLQFARTPKAEPHYEKGYMGAKKVQDRELLLPRELLQAAKARDSSRGRDGPGDWKTTTERHRTTSSHRIMLGDVFGNDAAAARSDVATIGTASMNFVRAVVGGIHLHNGAEAAKDFFKQHILSRSLNLATLFAFERPHRDLVLLCNREGFEAPVARVISSTGQLSANAVFVIGIFSGRDKLGEGVGSSLAEAKLRGTVAALKAWYLYSPLDVTVPSETEKEEGQRKWKPNMVDWGEIVV